MSLMEIGGVILGLIIFFAWFIGMHVIGLVIARKMTPEMTDDEFWQMMEDAAKEQYRYQHPWDMM